MSPSRLCGPVPESTAGTQTEAQGSELRQLPPLWSAQ